MTSCPTYVRFMMCLTTVDFNYFTLFIIWLTGGIVFFFKWHVLLKKTCFIQTRLLQGQLTRGRGGLINWPRKDGMIESENLTRELYSGIIKVGLKGPWEKCARAPFAFARMYTRPSISWSVQRAENWSSSAKRFEPISGGIDLVYLGLKQKTRSTSPPYSRHYRDLIKGMFGKCRTR